MAHPPTAVPRGPLPLKALETTAARPWPVRHLSPKIADYVAKMPPVWVEGQVLNVKRWNQMYFLTLRDTDVDMSVQVTLPAAAVLKVGGDAGVQDGAHLVVHARPTFHLKKGSLGLAGDEVRLVGAGELLARIEHLKGILAAEGLFDAARKRPLPFLPAVVGLVCAQQGDAEHDVVSTARARWPQVEIEIRRVTVQGAQAVPSVVGAIAELDADPRVEVIVVARGGGSFEDLLPFSNETLVRAAAACRTPLVSAIGHEKDSPVLDLVADFRASTPTAAAKRVVPDVGEERARVVQARARTRAAITQLLRHETERLTALRSRPVLAGPLTMLEPREREVRTLREVVRRALDRVVQSGSAEVDRLAAQVRALSPASTLERGYAVVQRVEDGAVVRSPNDVRAGDRLRLRVAQGEVGATVDSE
ncbi:exodeoxyribonuclease VII large subunit [Actinotalea sp. K2]|nr:exodeoxyribonuclease VII large subunit [Actinotalea sp. K2]MCL3862577.1 exodeoxyribonuclease VII large subunit [Actinotalea sp. K2]